MCVQLSDATVSVQVEGESGVLQLDRPAIELLLVFQRTIQAVIFAEYMKMTETQDKEKGAQPSVYRCPFKYLSCRLYTNLNTAWSCVNAGQIC